MKLYFVDAGAAAAAAVAANECPATDRSLGRCGDGVYDEEMKTD